jgi:hypothetical protein
LSVLTGPDPACSSFTGRGPARRMIVVDSSAESMNGLKNRSTAPARMSPGDPEFFQLVELIRKVQRSREIGMRIEVDKGKKETTVLTFQRRAHNA